MAKVYEKMEKEMLFYKELKSLINKHSLENVSNTPDLVLVDFLINCLAAFDAAILHREELEG